MLHFKYILSVYWFSFAIAMDYRYPKYDFTNPVNIYESNRFKCLEKMVTTFGHRNSNINDIADPLVCIRKAIVHMKLYGPNKFEYDQDIVDYYKKFHLYINPAKIHSRKLFCNMHTCAYVNHQVIPLDRRKKDCRDDYDRCIQDLEIFEEFNIAFTAEDDSFSAFNVNEDSFAASSVDELAVLAGLSNQQQPSRSTVEDDPFPTFSEDDYALIGDFSGIADHLQPNWNIADPTVQYQYTDQDGFIGGSSTHYPYAASGSSTAYNPYAALGGSSVYNPYEATGSSTAYNPYEATGSSTAFDPSTDTGAYETPLEKSLKGNVLINALYYHKQGGRPRGSVQIPGAEKYFHVFPSFGFDFLDHVAESVELKKDSTLESPESFCINRYDN